MAKRDKRLARAEAQLRYGGQINALKRLRKQRLQQFRTEREQFERAGKMNEKSAADAVPSVQKAMNDWMGPVATARSKALEGEANKLPDGIYKSVLRAEATEAPTRLTKTLSDTVAELALRRSNARIQSQQGIEGAYQRMRGDRDKITGELRDLTGQSSLYRITRQSELSKERAQTKRQRRKDRLSEQNMRADNQRADQALEMRKEQARKKERAAKKPKVSPSRIEKASSDLGYARTKAQEGKREGQPRHVIAKSLVEGTPNGRDAEGNPTQGVKKTPTLWASIALDLAYDGHISKRNRQRLHQLGYSMRDLGIPKSKPRIVHGRGRYAGPPTPKK